MMTTTTTITKTRTMAGTIIIKYQMIIQLVMHHMMIMISIMAIPKITIKMIMTHQKAGIITPNMRNMKMTMMNLKVMVEMQMTLNKMKKILVQQEEETDGVRTDPYPALITKMHLTGITGIKWLLTYALQ